MKIRIKLMGMLKDKSPVDGLLEVKEDSTIYDALLAMDIEADSVQVFTVNGALVRDKQHILSPDDELTVLPPVGGG